MHSLYDTYWSFSVNRFNNKFLIIERNVTDFTPRETNLGCQSEKVINIFTYNQ